MFFNCDCLKKKNFFFLFFFLNLNLLKKIKKKNIQQSFFYFLFFTKKNFLFSSQKYLKKQKKYINFFPRKIQERIFGDLFLRFLESFFGSKIIFFFIRNLWLHYNIFVEIQELLFSKRIIQYSGLAIKKKKGQWWWGSKILSLSVGLKDPMLLVSWLQTRLRYMNLYSHRRFFRLLGLLLSHVARIDNLYNFRGFYMRLVGKISVVGNAMSRSWWTRGGFASGSNLSLQLFSAFSIVRTNTGCLGLTLFFFY